MNWRFLAYLPSLPPEDQLRGGPQLRPFQLFTRFADLGHQVEVYETDRVGAPWSRGPLRVAPTRTLRRGPLGLGLRLREIYAEIRAVARDARARGQRFCFYAQVPSSLAFKAGMLPTPIHPGALFLRYAKRLGATTWAGVHDLSPDHELDLLARAPHAYTRGDRARVRTAAAFAELQQRTLLPHVDMISAVSPPMCQALIERYSLDPQRVRVFWSGAPNALLEPIPAWTPPAPGEAWRVGYLGSPLDISFEFLARSLRALGRQDVVLLLGGVNASQSAGAARAHFPRVEVMDGIRYADYARFAERVDLWALPYADRYCLDVTWQLKVPMALGSGRPVVRSPGKVVDSSDLKEHFYLAPADPERFSEALAEVLEDPAAAKARAEAARADVLARYAWTAIADQLLAALEVQSARSEALSPLDGS